MGDHFKLLSTTLESVSCSVMSDSATPWTVAPQVPLSVDFSRQEYWSRLPFPSPGVLPNLGIEPRSPALEADSLPSERPGRPQLASRINKNIVRFIIFLKDKTYCKYREKQLEIILRTKSKFLAMKFFKV